MGYYEDFCRLLRPLGIYELSEGAGMGELRALGSAMDCIRAGLDCAEREAILATAEDEGLDAWESLLPFIPSDGSPEMRREAIAALLRVDESGFTTAALNDTIAGCGISAVVSEASQPETLLISLTRPRGIPEDFPAIRSRVEQILPCHLDVEYKFIYTLWQEFLACGFSWDALADMGMDWKTVEIYLED